MTLIGCLWFVAIFVLYICLDVCWAWYTEAVQARKALKAANYAAVLLVIGVLGGISAYNHSPVYAIAMVMGSWLGTFWAVRRLANE